MKKHAPEIVRGSGNVYRDFNLPDADVRQLKAILAAAIIKTLDQWGLTSATRSVLRESTRETSRAYATQIFGASASNAS